MTEKRENKKPKYPVIAFRISEDMKAQMKEIISAKGWTSDGEFYRSVFRQVIRQYKEGKG